jgi:Holliday junction resolvase-like predicted endonuclease
MARALTQRLTHHECPGDCEGFLYLASTHLDGVTIEEPAGSLLTDYFKKSDDTKAHSALSPGQRIDIVAWKDDAPTAAVEVKRWGNNTGDIPRLACLLHNQPKIQLGAVLFAIDAPDEQRYRETFEVHVEYLSKLAANYDIALAAKGEMSQMCSRWGRKDAHLGFCHTVFRRS